MHRFLREVDLLPFDRFLSEEGVAFVWESWLAGALRADLLLTIRQTSKAQLLAVGGRRTRGLLLTPSRGRHRLER